MPSWRITKYDPARRGPNGVFLDDDWTSVSDIGDRLSVAEYLRVESAYVAAVRAFLADVGVTRLVVHGLEGPHDPPRILGTDDPAASIAVAEGTELDLDGIAAACRRVLREDLWCRLEAPGFAVHFGYDYYMFIESDAPCETAVAQAASTLFVEPIDASPYRR